MGWTQQTGKSYNVILCVPDLKTSWKLCSLWTHPKHYKFKDRSWKINSKFILVVASGEDGVGRTGERMLLVNTKQTQVRCQGVLGHRVAVEVIRCLDSGSILKGKWHIGGGVWREKG